MLCYDHYFLDAPLRLSSSKEFKGRRGSPLRPAENPVREASSFWQNFFPALGVNGSHKLNIGGAASAFSVKLVPKYDHFRSFLAEKRFNPAVKSEMSRILDNALVMRSFEDDVLSCFLILVLGKVWF